MDHSYIWALFHIDLENEFSLSLTYSLLRTENKVNYSRKLFLWLQKYPPIGSW